jgi:hypothetical protein
MNLFEPKPIKTGQDLVKGGGKEKKEKEASFSG